MAELVLTAGLARSYPKYTHIVIDSRTRYIALSLPFLSNMQNSPPEISLALLSEYITEEEFFQNVPPGQAKKITGLKLVDSGSGYSTFKWEPKDLYLYCTSEECSGFRKFSTVGKIEISKADLVYSYAYFRCRNCNRSGKRYAFRIKRLDEKTFDIYKLGEVPQFGPPTPNKVLSLMGGERDAFLKGRQCENQGLGIAAFAYYRRVVENQKSKIIGEILKVAEKLAADPELITELQTARNETRFSEAIKAVKHGLPQVLLINGHNPLTLLHSALSEGLHDASDESCLELATSIRVVLTELVERIATAVKEEAELTSAVQRLVQAAGKR